jgi:hypothetical protein
MPRRAAMLPFADSRDGTVYLVLDSQADRSTVVADLLSGQYRHPLRVVAFNTAEGRERDVTEIAREVLARAAELDHELPAAVRDFVQRAGA